MLHAQDSAMISPSRFANTIMPGMVLEMSIILRQTDPFQENKEMCPRCSHINLNAHADRGWIEWEVPPLSHMCDNTNLAFSILVIAILESSELTQWMEVEMVTSK